MSNITFSHGNEEELTVKRELLALAQRNLERSYQEKDKDLAIALELSSALIYMNVADYLAEYLAKGVSNLARISVGKYYFGQIAIKSLPQKGITIGDSIAQLKKYSFPKKEELIPLLEELNKRRKTVAHELLKTKPKELINVDKVIDELAEKTHELVNIVDEIQPGMPPRNMGEVLENINTEKKK